MNRLKHILGVNVPRHVSSNVSPSCHRQRADKYIKNRQLRSHLLKSDTLNAAKRNHGAGIKCSGKFCQDDIRLLSKGSKTICKPRSKTRCNVASLKKSSTEKRLSLENVIVITRPYSACKSVKFNSSETNKRHVSRNVATVAGTKNVNRNNSFAASLEKYPRSYAEMITDYTEALYKGSAVGTQNDRPYFSNAIRKSPFSTLSAPPMRKKIVSIVEHSGVLTEKRESDSPLFAGTIKFDRSIKRDNENAAERWDFQRNDARTTGITSDNGNEITLHQPYVKLITNCSKSAHDISLASASNGSDSALKRNAVPTNSLESIVTPMRKASNINTQGTTVATTLIKKDVQKQVTDKIDEIEKRKSDLALQKHNYSQYINAPTDAYLMQHLGDATRTSNSLVKKSSTQASDSGNILKQSQVELRMAPSEKESIVSINVDSARLLDPLNPNAKQLSVIVQSDQRRDPHATESQRNALALRRGSKSAASQQRSDFGPMRISISEDSAPVKQIEFSINGKPVSELKSITARTERLDVVSSADKIEIRIPFAKDDASAVSKIRGSEESRRVDSSTEQILNVQISASFQNKPTKGNTERSFQETINTIPTSLPQNPKTHYFYDDSANARETTFHGNYAQQRDSSNRMDVKSDNEIKKNFDQYETPSYVDRKIQRETAMKLSTDKTIIDKSSVAEANNSDVGKLKANKQGPRNATQSLGTHNYEKSEPSDSRVLSKMIPWWSSSDCFNKIRKKEEHKLVVPSNLNEKKAVSNLRKNLVAESPPSKLNEMSDSSKESKKKLQLTNNAAVGTNNLSDTSDLDSSKQYEESKPSIQYSSLFRLKPNWNSDTVSEISRGDLKIDNKQPLSMEKDNQKKSEIKRTKQVTFSETADVQNDASTELDTHDAVKASTSSKQSKAPKSAQVLSPENNREKKHNYPLQQTKSINDISSAKSKIENILDAIKPIEKRKDGTLIDYGLKVSSRKPTVTLDSKVIKIQNSPATAVRAKDTVSDRSTMEIISKREQIGKATSAKQTESDETKKVETKMHVVKGKEGQVKKQGESIGDTIVLQGSSTQHLKALSEDNKNKPNNLSSTKTASEMTRQSEKSGISVHTSSEALKRNKSESSSSVKNTAPGIIEIQTSEKLKGSKSSELENDRHSFKKSTDKEIVDRKKSPLEASQTKSNLASKIKGSAVLNDSIDKNARSPVTHQDANKSNKRTDVENVIAKIVTQKPASESFLPKDCEKNRPYKSKSNKDGGNFSGSNSFPRKPSNSAGFKSSSSQLRMKSGIKYKDSCAYTEKLLIMESYANFNRKDSTLSNAHPAAYETSQNLSNIDDDVSKNHAPGVTGSTGPWINMNRPEKSMLYSAWLHRFRNNINDNEKLF